MRETPANQFGAARTETENRSIGPTPTDCQTGVRRAAYRATEDRPPSGWDDDDDDRCDVFKVFTTLRWVVKWL